MHLLFEQIIMSASMKAAFVGAKVWLNLMLLLKVCIVLYCSAIRVHLYVCRCEDKIMAMDAIQGSHKISMQYCTPLLSRALQAGCYNNMFNCGALLWLPF